MIPRSCPRCGGDLFLERDEYHDYYLHCLQCGDTRDIKPLEPLKLVRGIGNRMKTGGKR